MSKSVCSRSQRGARAARRARQIGRGVATNHASTRERSPWLARRRIGSSGVRRSIACMPFSAVGGIMASEQVSTQQGADKDPNPQSGEQTGQTAMQPSGGSNVTAMRPERSSSMGRAMGPFSLTRRLSEEMDRLFDDFFGRDFWGASMLAPWQERSRGQELTFWPQIEIAQRGNTIEIRADVPGLKREDLNVEIRDNALCISGERRSETERQEGSVYRSERSYGRFSRSVPLP